MTRMLMPITRRLQLSSLVGGAFFMLGGCSGLQFQPSYGTQGMGPGGAIGAAPLASILVEYEAVCEGRCVLRFSLPGPSPAGEEFTGTIRRNIQFPGGSARGLTLTVQPVQDVHLVRRAQIQVDGKLRAYLLDADVRPGKKVSLTTALVPAR